ncbi:hypothetical protein ROS9278_01978 [Roseomonas sp. CECT 9278]|nr:hypothetical protein ROS9278_01978 [Roseomonas sp. CECT 9278]
MRPPGLRRPPRFATFAASMTQPIAITVNGESRDVAAGDTVAALLRAIGLDTRKVAVERNEEIVPRSTYDSVALAPGDRLEIVHFIGGG